jgi:hypothetical protein
MRTLDQLPSVASFGFAASITLPYLSAVPRGYLFSREGTGDLNRHGKGKGRSRPDRVDTLRAKAKVGPQAPDRTQRRVPLALRTQHRGFRIQNR